MLTGRDYNLPSRVMELEKKVHKLELELEKMNNEKTCCKCSNKKIKGDEKV